MLTKNGPFFSTSVMRAVVVSKFGGPEVLQIKRNVPIPVPRVGEVLVKVAAAGVNPGDADIRAGRYGPLPELPYTPGSDMCGTVVQIGQGVKKFKEGDRVASVLDCRSGAYAEYCAIRSDRLVHLPPGFDFRLGAAVGVPYFTAYKALFGKAQPKPNDVILIHGASGGVGVAACQLAVGKGFAVIGTAGSQEGIEIVKKLGVHLVFNHKEDGYTSKIMDATDGGGPNIILEMLSNVNLNEDLKMVAPGGSIVVIGCRGSVEINPRLTLVKETTIYGLSLSSTTREDFSAMNKAICAGLKQGWLLPCIGGEYELNSVRKAHEAICQNSAKGKVILAVY